MILASVSRRIRMMKRGTENGFQKEVMKCAKKGKNKSPGPSSTFKG
jgi:hypothetical protein